MYKQGQIVDYMAETDIQGRVTKTTKYAIREDNGDFLEAECPKTGMKMTLLRDCICTPEEDTPRHFYVSCKEHPNKHDSKALALLGPYPTWEDAEKQKDRGRQLAYDADPKACWYGYGICSSPASVELKTVFGA